MSVNKVILVGNLGADPEVAFLPSGESVVNFRIATTERWKDKTSGEPKEHTEWHRIAVYGKRAEFAGTYLKKGSKVYVEGRLRTREYEQDGVKKYSTDILASDVQSMDKRPDNAE